MRRSRPAASAPGACGKWVAHYSAGVIRTAFDEIITRTERRLRDAIAGVPDGGYTFEDVMDGDGAGTVDIPIRLEVTIAGDRAHFDFAGTSPQVEGNVNVTMNATQAAVCYALKAMLDPEVPNNQGVLAVADIDAAPGTLLNARFPAPVASRAHTCQRIIDVVPRRVQQGAARQGHRRRQRRQHHRGVLGDGSA